MEKQEAYRSGDQTCKQARENKMKNYTFEIHSEIENPLTVDHICPWMNDEVSPEVLDLTYNVTVKAENETEAKEHIKLLVYGKCKDNWIGKKIKVGKKLKEIRKKSKDEPLDVAGAMLKAHWR
jgi:hypothetical protein